MRISAPAGRYRASRPMPPERSFAFATHRTIDPLTGTPQAGRHRSPRPAAASRRCAGRPRGGAARCGEAGEAVATARAAVTVFRQSGADGSDDGDADYLPMAEEVIRVAARQ